MNNKAFTLASVFALLAVFFMYSYVTSVEEESRKRNGTEVLAVVAKKDIHEMESVNETMLEFKAIPKKFLEPSAIALEKKEEDKESAKTLKALTGNVAIVPIRKGEQLTFNKLTDPGGRTGMAAQITPGKRAISVPVNELTGVSKLIKPGDRVDLLAVIDVGGGKENKVAKTVLQDLVVLATGRYITNNIARTLEVDPLGGKDRVRSLAEDFSFSSVTLEVEPAQVQTISLLMFSGDNSLTLVLRNNDDLDRVNLPNTTLADIVGNDVIQRAKAQKR